jgi:hypothetical protein
VCTVHGTIRWWNHNFLQKALESLLMNKKEDFATMLGLQKRNPTRQPRKPENVPLKQQNNSLEQTVPEQKLTEQSDPIRTDSASSSSANGNLDGAHDTGSHVLPPPVTAQPVQSSQWGGGKEFLSLFSHVQAPNGAPHPFASSWQVFPFIGSFSSNTRDSVSFT